MRLTTKGRFAVTAMVDLAMRQNRGPVTLADLVAHQNGKQVAVIKDFRQQQEKVAA